MKLSIKPQKSLAISRAVELTLYSKPKPTTQDASTQLIKTTKNGYSQTNWIIPSSKPATKQIKVIVKPFIKAYTKLPKNCAYPNSINPEEQKRKSKKKYIEKKKEEIRETKERKERKIDEHIEKIKKKRKNNEFVREMKKIGKAIVARNHMPGASKKEHTEL